MESRNAKGDVARLQSFSDAVFALSATLLVVSVGEVPRSYDALMDSLLGFPAFAIAFAALISLWYNHRLFFSRYPVGDGVIVAINSVLLFVILLYVYPLRLLAAVVSESFFGLSAEVTLGMGIEETRGLLLIFGAAAVSTTLCFLALHARAWQQRDALELQEARRYELRREIVLLLILMLVPITSVVLAARRVALSWGLPVWVYVAGLAVVPIVVSIEAMRSGRRPGTL
jgi:uncharacterized membrane protein